jgi:hypothetical protein
MAGVYFMQGQDFQEIYGKNAFFFGGEYTIRFPVREQHGADIALSLRQLRKSGKTSYTGEATRLRLTTLAFSLRYSLESGDFTFFLGPGLDYVMYRERYAETFPVSAVQGSALGLHATSGVYYRFLEAVSLKAYFKYSSVETETAGFRVNLGGTEWVLGVVYRFEF